MVRRFAIVLVQQVDEKRNRRRMPQRTQHVEQVHRQVHAVFLWLVERIGSHLFRHRSPAIEDRFDERVVGSDAAPARFVQKVAQWRGSVLRRQK